jgi:hypothetical protein
MYFYSYPYLDIIYGNLFLNPKPFKSFSLIIVVEVQNRGALKRVIFSDMLSLGKLEGTFDPCVHYRQE